MAINVKKTKVMVVSKNGKVKCNVTLDKKILEEKRVNAFEQWCYRRMLKKSWKDKVTNENVLDRIETKLHFMKVMKKRKLEYSGHVLRGSSGNTHFISLEGKVSGKRAIGRPRATWLKDIIDWTRIDSYEEIKRAAEDRRGWKTMAVNLLTEDDQ